MPLETLLAIIAAGVALVVTPIWLFLGYRGVRSLTDIRDMLRRPPGEPRR
jgi:hypothetical protein